MGIALWLGCGLVAFLLARWIPAGRGRGWIDELLATLAASFSLGTTATALDFGGWRELDWRAGLFAFLGAFAAVGVLRAIRDAFARVRPEPPRPRV